MNQGELIAQLSKSLSIPTGQAKAYLAAHLAILTKQLVAGERIVLPGFGVFTVKPRAAREGVNPATKEKMQIPASKTVSFKAGQSLKSAVNTSSQ